MLWGVWFTLKMSIEFMGLGNVMVLWLKRNYLTPDGLQHAKLRFQLFSFKCLPQFFTRIFFSRLADNYFGPKARNTSNNSCSIQINFHLLWRQRKKMLHKFKSSQGEKTAISSTQASKRLLWIFNYYVIRGDGIWYEYGKNK